MGQGTFAPQSPITCPKRQLPETLDEIDSGKLVKKYIDSMANQHYNYLMNEIRLFLTPFLLLLLVLALGLFSLLYGYNRSRIMEELVAFNNRFTGTIVEVRTRRGTDTHISFIISGNDEIYRGRMNFGRYRKLIYVGKEITVLFDTTKKEYIIENFIGAYQSGYRWLILFGSLLIAIPLVGTVYFFISIYSR